MHHVEQASLHYLVQSTTMGCASTVIVLEASMGGAGGWGRRCRPHWLQGEQAEAEGGGWVGGGMGGAAERRGSCWTGGLEPWQRGLMWLHSNILAALGWGLGHVLE